MKPTASKVDLEKLFPLLGVSDTGVAVSKKGAMTFGWEMSLPVMYSLSEEEYDGMIHALEAAVRILPPWYVVHRQDMYTYEEWSPAPDAPRGFFSEAFDEHFRGRPYLVHRAYLFLTMSSFGGVMKTGRKSGLFGIGFERSAPSRKEFETFTAKCTEFSAILTSGGAVSLRPLSSQEWTGTEDTPGIVQRYMMFGDRSAQLSDIALTRESVTHLHKKAQAFSIGSAEILPPALSSIRRNELLSSEGNAVFRSLGAGLGAALECEHVVNTVIVSPNQEMEKARLASEQKKMKAGTDDDENALSAQEIQRYKELIINESPFTVKANVTVIAWDDEDRFDALTGKLSSAFSSIGVVSSYVKYNAPLLWYAGIPGNAQEIGSENLMTMELLSCLVLCSWDTFQKDIPGGMLRICDRTRHVPVTIDTQRIAQSLGWIFDLNAFILGPSGTGKSFFMNYYLRNCYDAGESCFVIDVGDSYQGLCSVIREESSGADGQYMSWDASHPLVFNPFIGHEDWLDLNGNVRADSSGANFFISLIETIWAPKGGWTSDSEPILKQTVSDFLREAVPDILASGRKPVFDDYYNYLNDTVRPALAEGRFTVVGNPVQESEFESERLTRALSAYSSKGVYHFLLNEQDPADLFTSRFIVFEVSQLSQVKDRKFYSLCILCIMNCFDRKMREKVEEFDIMVIEEAWKAISNETMAPYLRELWKTARKYNTSAVVVTQSMEDIVASDIIKDAILANSSTKILLDQSSNRKVFGPIAEALALNQNDLMKIFSMNLGKDPRYHYRDVFIKLGEGFSGVFSTEPSPEEALAYESAKDRKAPLLSLAAQKGSMLAAIRELSGSSARAQYDPAK